MSCLLQPWGRAHVIHTEVGLDPELVWIAQEEKNLSPLAGIEP
jgi:hypothetical protein